MKVQVRTNSNRKLTGISHSCVISWLSEELFFLPHNQRLELSSWWSCSIIYRSLSISGITSYLSYACGTPPILVKGSHDPSVKSQRHFSILISTLCTGHPLRVFVMHSALPTCPQPLPVRSLQLVEVRPCAEEEEEDWIMNEVLIKKAMVKTTDVTWRQSYHSMQDRRLCLVRCRQG